MAGSAALRVSLAALAGAVVATFGLGLTYNTTPSLPMGLYRLRRLDIVPQRGQVVGFCLVGKVARLALARGYVPPQGLEPFVYQKRCASGTSVIGKPVAGIPGDTIEVRHAGVFVNGRLLRRSAPLARDRAGRNLPTARGRFVLGPRQYWLQSEFAQNSFDSRIFGPVSQDDILDRRVFVVGFAPLLGLALGVASGACVALSRAIPLASARRR